MLWEKVFSFLLIPQKHHSADLDICRVLGERDGLFSLAQTYLTPETLHSVSISPQTEAGRQEHRRRHELAMWPRPNPNTV